MATLPYIQLYVSDYLADTMHLTAEEHGAYLLLIMNYWQTEKPIPESRLQGITRVFNDRWTTVKSSLSDFFKIDENGCWYHERIEKDLEKIKLKSQQASEAGRKSAEKRAKEKPLDSEEVNDRSTTVQRKVNDRSTIKDKREKRKDNNNNAEDVYDFYKTNIKASTRKQSSINNINKWLKEYDKDTLIKAINNYKPIARKQTDIKFVKECSNFFGVTEASKGYFIDYIDYKEEKEAILITDKRHPYYSGLS